MFLLVLLLFWHFLVKEVPSRRILSKISGMDYEKPTRYNSAKSTRILAIFLIPNDRDTKAVTVACFLIMTFRFIATVSLCFQVFRTFISTTVFRKVFPGYKWSILISAVGIGLSVLLAAFYNEPGMVFTIAGSITGLYFAIRKRA